MPRSGASVRSLSKVQEQRPHNGPNTANGVTVTDSLPTGMSYVSAVPSQGTCDEAAGEVTCELGGLADDGVATVSSPFLAVSYLIWSYTLNIGRYIAITMKPTMAPTTMIMIGSRIEVRALTAAATWSS